MKNYIQYEIYSFFSKRTITSLFLCLICMMIGFFYDSYQFNQAYPNEVDKYKESSRYEQSHIDILTYDIEYNNEDKEDELKFWLEELQLTNNLVYAYQNQDDTNILKYRLLRNENLIYGIKKNYVNQRIDFCIVNGNQQDLKKQIKIDQKNKKLNMLDGIVEGKPTLFHSLKEVQNGNYILWILLFLILLLNGDIWSKEFSGYGGYQILFSYPLKKYELVFVRNFIYGIITVFCSILLFGTVSFMCFILYGGGFEQFVIQNNELVYALKSVLNSFPLFFVSFLSYIHLIQFLSILLKDEMNTYFVYILLSLLSVFFSSNLNIYSYIQAYAANHVILKSALTIFFNVIFMIIEFVCVEKKDLTR